MRVLIIEDSPLMAKVLTLLIERGGSCVVGKATSAEEALPLAREWQPDVVTLDLNLDGGGSLTLIAELSALGVPVVVVSAATYPGSPATVEALRHGAVACIDKARLSLSGEFVEALEAAQAPHLAPMPLQSIA